MRGAILIILLRTVDGGYWYDREYTRYEHYNLTYCYGTLRSIRKEWKENFIKGSCRLETNEEYSRRIKDEEQKQ